MIYNQNMNHVKKLISTNLNEGREFVKRKRKDMSFKNY